MKILYLSTPFFADCDFPLVKTFQKAGYDVTYLVVLKPNTLRSTLFDIKRQLPKNDIIPARQYIEIEMYEKYMDLDKVYVVNQTCKENLSLKALWLMLRVIQFIRQGNFDIVHTDAMQDLYGYLLYFLFRQKMVLTVHDPFPHSGEMSKRKKFNYRIAMKVLKHFVLLNNNQKSRFCAIYNLNPTQVVINKLGIYDNIRIFVNSSIKEQPNNVLFFGRISPYKGIEYLCEAMKKVKLQISDATLTIAGGGRIYFDIEPYKQYDWIDIRNHYIGMEELAQLLQQCSITVCPYTDATQSGVIMTSYSLNKPVIASNVGGLSEMVEDGKTGLLVPPKNVDALAEKIIKLLKDRNMKESMSKYIKDNYENKVSWSSIVEQYISCYSNI